MTNPNLDQLLEEGDRQHDLFTDLKVFLAKINISDKLDRLGRARGNKLEFERARVDFSNTLSTLEDLSCDLGEIVDELAGIKTGVDEYEAETELVTDGRK